MLPFPFSRGCFIWGTPLWVERLADESILEIRRQELEATLCSLGSEADTVVRHPQVGESP